MLLAELPELFPTAETEGCKSWMLGALPRSECAAFPERRSAAKHRDQLPRLPRADSCGGARRRPLGCHFGTPQNSTSHRRPSTPSALSRALPCCTSSPAPQECHEGSVNFLQGSSAKLQCRSPCKMQQVREEYEERRAQEAAAKIQRAKEQKEKMDEIKKTLADAVVALGESVKFGSDVVSLIEKRGRLLKMVDESGSIVEEELRPYMEEVKVTWFERKLMATFPSWRLTELQKKELVKDVLSKQPASELSKMFIDERSHAWRDALASAMKRIPQLFTCPICMDPLVELSPQGYPQTSNMWFAPLQKNEHWSSQPCGHACCRTCMSTWAETAINDQKVNVRCPAPCCSYSLFDHDIKALVSPEAFERFHEHKNADYLKHLKSALKEDHRLNTWLKSNARPCPDCHVLVSRYEGCDQMQCVCGTRFCYACGFKSCKCGQSYSKRKDIWKPKAAPRTSAEA